MTRLMTLVGLLTAISSQAATSVVALPRFAVETSLSQTTKSYDDDDDEEDAAPTPSPAGDAVAPLVPAPTAPTATPAPTNAPAAPPPVADEDPRAQQLVGGAPLYNPNVAVHIVEKKQFSDRGKHEIVLFPAAVQANGKFTQHIGSALSYVYHLHENFGFQVTPQFNWSANESSFNRELVDKVRQEAQAATSLLLVWGVQAGVEVTPLYGKFAFYEGSLAHFALVLSGGAGLGSTKTQLKPDNDAGPATFGDTGLKFLGSLGGGFRVQLGDRFALRLEVRDLVYTARVDQVSGCNADDLRAMEGGTPSSVIVSDACQLDAFTDDDARFRQEEVHQARTRVETPSSDALNNVGVYAGFSFLF